PGPARRLCRGSEVPRLDSDHRRRADVSSGAPLCGSGAGSRGAEEDRVVAVGLLQTHVDTFTQGGGEVLTHVVGTDGQFSVSSVDEDGELYRTWPAEVTKSVQSGAYGMTGEEDVVDQNDDPVVEPTRGEFGPAKCTSGGQTQIVAVHGDVEGAGGNVEILHTTDASGQSVGEGDPARGDTQKSDVLAALGAFEHLVGDAGQRPVDLGAVEDGAGVVGWCGPGTVGVTARRFSRTQSSDSLPCLTGQVVKGCRSETSYQRRAAPKRAPGNTADANVTLATLEGGWTAPSQGTSRPHTFLAPSRQKVESLAGAGFLQRPRSPFSRTITI